jgi:hypothetical protein
MLCVLYGGGTVVCKQYNLLDHPHTTTSKAACTFDYFCCSSVVSCILSVCGVFELCMCTHI